MQESFYTREELISMNFRSIGTDVKISRFARFYGNSKMSIGNNVRIDDFCLLSGSVTLKNNIHISAYCALYGGGRIIMHDNSGLSPRCTLLSATDDFSGNFLIGPHNDLENTNVLKAPIVLNKYCQLGANTVVLPGVVFEEGSATGAMSFVNKSTKKWYLYIGSPAKAIKKRSNELLNLIDE